MYSAQEIVANITSIIHCSEKGKELPPCYCIEWESLGLVSERHWCV